ncbi:MAG: hypothetical protein H6872_08980 [Methylobacteriaceae bacterium]|nr:hypothetical protein [Methylobacteriaceae bacterium]
MAATCIGAPDQSARARALVEEAAVAETRQRVGVGVAVAHLGAQLVAHRQEIEPALLARGEIVGIDDNAGDRRKRHGVDDGDRRRRFAAHEIGGRDHHEDGCGQPDAPGDGHALDRGDAQVDNRRKIDVARRIFGRGERIDSQNLRDHGDRDGRGQALAPFRAGDRRQDVGDEQHPGRDDEQMQRGREQERVRREQIFADDEEIVDERGAQRGADQKKRARRGPVSRS